jgi:hypothetical protein
MSWLLQQLLRKASLPDSLVYIHVNFLLPVGGCGVGNLTEPVAVSLRHWAEGADPMAAWWSQEGPGGWSSEGCQLRSSQPNVSSLHCQHLGNVAVLMVGMVGAKRWEGKGTESVGAMNGVLWSPGPQRNTERTAAFLSPVTVRVHGK